MVTTQGYRRCLNFQMTSSPDDSTCQLGFLPTSARQQKLDKKMNLQDDGPQRLQEEHTSQVDNLVTDSVSTTSFRNGV
jgi:hypothetical protein